MPRHWRRRLLEGFCLAALALWPNSISIESVSTTADGFRLWRFEFDAHDRWPLEADAHRRAERRLRAP